MGPTIHRPATNASCADAPWPQPWTIRHGVVDTGDRNGINFCEFPINPILIHICMEIYWIYSIKGETYSPWSQSPYVRIFCGVFGFLFFSEVSHLLNILVCYRLLIKQFCSFGVQHPFLVPSHFPIEHRVMRWFTFVECHYSHCCLWNSTGKKDLAYFYLVLYLLTVSILPNSLTQHQVCRLRGQARYQLDQFQAPHTAVVGCADCPVPWSWYLSETTKPGVIYNAY